MTIGLTEFFTCRFESKFGFTGQLSLSKNSLIIASFGGFWPQLDSRLGYRKATVEFAESASLVTKSPFEQSVYFDELAERHSIGCPHVRGVHAPKTPEASVTMTIPVLTDSTMGRPWVNKVGVLC